MIELLRTILQRTRAGERVAMGVVVRSRGSTPQKIGASMVVLANGQTLGTLGGGCVEAETRVRAMKAIEKGEHELLDFKLDQDYGWDDGMVCGGMMDIAIQTYVPGDEILLGRVRDCLGELEARRPALMRIETSEQVFEIAIGVSPRLVIAGAGHVSQAVAKVAGQMEFDLVVVDDREDFANASRFPGARCVVGTIDIELAKLVKSNAIDRDTFVLIVTRGHKNDEMALSAVIGSSAGYVGLIGSKKKIRTILGNLHASGVSRERLEAVHAPVGLELGAVSPTEIAVSILAELIAVRRGVVVVRPMKLEKSFLDSWLDRDQEKQSSNV